MPTAAILTDLDNTIYNWVDYFGKCFRAMLHVLARSTGSQETILAGQFREIFARYGSVEYPFSIQELPTFSQLNNEEIAALIAAVRGALRRVRQSNLSAYAGVKETLVWARAEGIDVIGVSNAPLFQAKMRLAQLHLDGYFSGLAAWDGFGIPEADPYTATLRVRDGGSGWRCRLDSPGRRLWRVPKQDLKPHSGMYQMILSDLRLAPEEVWVIGDSRERDLLPATALGVRTAWARYGVLCDPRNSKTLASVTHWKQDETPMDPTAAPYPTCVLDRFDEIRTRLSPRQGTLF